VYGGNEKSPGNMGNTEAAANVLLANRSQPVVQLTPNFRPLAAPIPVHNPRAKALLVQFGDFRALKTETRLRPFWSKIKA
jgi:hypothetical protein